MTVQHEYLGNGLAFRFSGKPSEAIRSALKNNGFRWMPSQSVWFRNRIGKWADLLCWIRGQLGAVGDDAAVEEARQYERDLAADDFDMMNNRCM